LSTEEKILNEVRELKKMYLKQSTPFLTLNECSEYLQISKNTIYQWSSKGIIPRPKLGRKLMFEKDVIDKLVLSHSDN